MSDINVNGTLIWYYHICQREVWLMSHNIAPDQDDTNVSVGRYIGEHTYEREKKELSVGGSRIDVFHIDNGAMVIGEVKKTSKYRASARMQLAFYLSELKERGLDARGELRFPKEKIREEVLLDERTEQELERVKGDILRIVYLDKPPDAKKIAFCKSCAYTEFCWC